MKTVICLLAALGLACGCRRPVPTTSPASELALAAKDQFEHGNYREAEKLYMEALATSPSDVNALANLGVVYYTTGKFKLAEESLKKAIAIAPQDDFSHCTLGIVHYTQGKFDDAMNELTKALAINPKNATAHHYLGVVASQKGWQEPAQKELQTATSLDPNYGDSLRDPRRNMPLGDFLTPLEKSRLKVPTGKYQPLTPPAPERVPR